MNTRSDEQKKKRHSSQMTRVETKLRVIGSRVRITLTPTSDAITLPPLRKISFAKPKSTSFAKEQVALAPEKSGIVDIRAMSLLRLIQDLEDMPTRVRLAFLFWAYDFRRQTAVLPSSMNSSVDESQSHMPDEARPEVADRSLRSTLRPIAHCEPAEIPPTPSASPTNYREGQGDDGETPILWDASGVAVIDAETLPTDGEDIADQTDSSMLSDEGSFLTPINLQLTDDALAILERDDDDEWTNQHTRTKCVGGVAKSGANDSVSDSSSETDEVPDHALDIIHSMSQVHQKLSRVARHARFENMKLKDRVQALDQKLQNIQRELDITQGEYTSLLGIMERIHDISGENVYSV